MRFENKLDKSIESHKKELQKELDIHKHELDKLKDSYQIQFDKFFQKKANALAEVFELLTNLKFVMGDYLNKLKIALPGKTIDETEKEQEENAHKNYKLFIQEFHKRRIFIGRDLCKRIDILLEDYNQCYKKYSSYMSIKGDTEVEREMRFENWKNYLESMNMMEKEIPKTLDEIEESFRLEYLEIRK